MVLMASPNLISDLSLSLASFLPGARSDVVLVTQDPKVTVTLSTEVGGGCAKDDINLSSSIYAINLGISEEIQ